MGCSKHLKRKIVFDDMVFYWYVGKDPRDAHFAKALHIAAPDKAFLAIYRLDFVSEGSRIDKLEIVKSNWIAPGFYALRQHTAERAVTPRLVADILRFCLGGVNRSKQNQ